MARGKLHINPDGPQTRVEVLEYISLFAQLTGRMPVKISVPRATFDGWSAWRSGTKPSPELPWDDPTNRGEKVCGLQVVLSDHFVLE